MVSRVFGFEKGWLYTFFSLFVCFFVFILIECKYRNHVLFSDWNKTVALLFHLNRVIFINLCCIAHYKYYIWVVSLITQLDMLIFVGEDTSTHTSYFSIAHLRIELHKCKYNSFPDFLQAPSECKFLISLQKILPIESNYWEWTA